MHTDQTESTSIEATNIPIPVLTCPPEYTLEQTPISLIGQTFFDQTLLLPFDGSPKLNIRAGKVERVSHGVQHACETAIISRSLATLVQYLKLDKNSELTEENLKCADVLAFSHDSGRKDDISKDTWENISQALCKSFLLLLGVSEEKAEAFSTLITLKEKGGLRGQIFQSADSVGNCRAKQTLFIEKMSLYQPATAEGKAFVIVALVLEIVKWIAGQFDVKFNVEVVENGRIIHIEKATRDPSRPELNSKCRTR